MVKCRVYLIILYSFVLADFLVGSQIDSVENSSSSDGEDEACDNNFYQIFVKIPCGKTITLIVNDDKSIDAIKQKICDKEGIPANLQKLIYGGKNLENGMKFGAYKINKESTLHVFLSMRGGGPLAINTVDVENTRALTTKEFSEAPPWREIDMGMHFKSRCFNQQCPAGKNTDHVCSMFGFGKFDAKNGLEDVCCPQCKEVVNPYNFGWTNCDVRIYSKKAALNTQARQSEWLHFEQGRETYFDLKEAGRAEFIDLIIEIAPFMQGGNGTFSMDNCQISHPKAGKIKNKATSKKPANATNKPHKGCTLL